MLNILILTASLVTPADSTPKSTPKRVSLFAVPVVYYAPETRFAFGGVGTATFRLGDRELTPSVNAGPGAATRTLPSNVSLLVAYTQNKQLQYLSLFQIFTKQNRYYLYGEAGYYKYSYNFYGLGQREVPVENYGVDYPRIRLNALRRVRPHLYAGLRGEYENYVVTKVVPGGLLASGTVPGGTGGRVVGAGLGIFYDIRNNVFFPSKGLVADFTYLGHGQTIGSNFRYNRYVADVSSYHKLTQRTIVAINYFVSMTGGTPPFDDLSLLGGAKKMRGYYEGRYRDQNVALLQVEGRVNLYKQVSAVIFGAVGIMGDDKRLFRTSEPKAAGGAGLRFRINDEGLNIRADYGFGNNSTGLYLTIGEAF